MKAENKVREYHNSVDPRLVLPHGWCRSGVNNENESKREGKESERAPSAPPWWSTGVF